MRLLSIEMPCMKQPGGLHVRRSGVLHANRRPVRSRQRRPNGTKGKPNAKEKKRSSCLSYCLFDMGSNDEVSELDDVRSRYAEGMVNGLGMTISASRCTSFSPFPLIARLPQQGV